MAPALTAYPRTEVALRLAGRRPPGCASFARPLQRCSLALAAGCAATTGCTSTTRRRGDRGGGPAGGRLLPPARARPTRARDRRRRVGGAGQREEDGRRAHAFSLEVPGFRGTSRTRPAPSTWKTAGVASRCSPRRVVATPGTTSRSPAGCTPSPSPPGKMGKGEVILLESEATDPYRFPTSTGTSSRPSAVAPRRVAGRGTRCWRRLALLGAITGRDLAGEPERAPPHHPGRRRAPEPALPALERRVASIHYVTFGASLRHNPE